MPSVASYAGTLRCIGQALQRQEIVVFELKVMLPTFASSVEIRTHPTQT